jgi:hypothetical protein
MVVWKPQESIKGGLGQKFNRKVYQQWQQKYNKLESVVLTRIYSSDPVDNSTKKKKEKGDFFDFFSLYVIKHCFIYRPSVSTVSEGTGIELRTVPTSALTAYLLSNK